MFERYKDPKESMGIGRKKDSILVKSIKLLIQQGTILIDKPYEVDGFLKDFEGIKDLDFRPYILPSSIILISEHEVEDTTRKMMKHLANNLGTPMTVFDEDKVFMKNEEFEIHLREYMGKTAFFQDKFYQLPSEEEIKKFMPQLLAFEEMRLARAHDKRESDQRRLQMMQTMAVAQASNTRKLFEYVGLNQQEIERVKYEEKKEMYLLEQAEREKDPRNSRIIW
jgi:hypothetical protein